MGTAQGKSFVANRGNSFLPAPRRSVMPQCPKGKLWTEPEMETQAFAALDRSMKEFDGDSERIYLTGISMGGYGLGI